MVTIHQLPALKDNYIYVLRNDNSDHTAVIDPSAAQPVIDFLSERGWGLNTILNTHHHWDHTDGNIELKKRFSCEVWGYELDSHRIPGIDKNIAAGQFALGHSSVTLMPIPGHTLGHVAYYMSDHRALFCGDTLFGMGCGHLFEGTPEQMFDSLTTLSKLPSETLVYCGHEYTEKNGRFALTIEPKNTAISERMLRIRFQGKPTVPSTLSEELATNPFLRQKNVEDFAAVRRKKDNFG